MPNSCCPFCGSEIKPSPGLAGVYQHATNVHECIIGDLGIKDLAAWHRRASSKQEGVDAARDGAVAKRREEKTDPIREEMARAMEGLVKAVGAEARREDHVNWAMQDALTALSKHRGHPPAHRSGK